MTHALRPQKHITSAATFFAAPSMREVEPTTFPKDLRASVPFAAPPMSGVEQCLHASGNHAFPAPLLESRSFTGLLTQTKPSSLCL